MVTGDAALLTKDEQRKLDQVERWLTGIKPGVPTPILPSYMLAEYIILRAKRDYEGSVPSHDYLRRVSLELAKNVVEIES